MQSLDGLVEYVNRYLRIKDVDDWDNALNGVQVQNSGSVTKIGAAVDVSTRALREAARRRIDLLIVHHGLFWPGLQPVIGALHRQLKIAFESNIAIYSAHLPLDVHPIVGNNARLAASLGVKPTKRFLEEKGQLIGVKASMSRSREELMRRLQTSVQGPVKSFAFGPSKTRTVGIVTGAAGSEIYRVAAENIDTFITGEAPHWAAVAAEELGMNLLLGGHYATETFGVKALAAHLAKKFQLPWEFVAFPTNI
jgi:dinuclear metal center YbgI/SA1388 family protein